MPNFQSGLVFQLFMIHIGLAIVCGPSALWCLVWVGYALYITYTWCIEPIREVTQQASKFIADTVDETTKSIGESINSSVQNVASNLKDAGDDLSKGACACRNKHEKSHGWNSFVRFRYNFRF